jgi:hypothetical protein
VGAEEEGARRAVVVAREVDHRSVLLPRLERPVGGGVSYRLQRRLAGRCWGFRLVPGLRLRLRRRHEGVCLLGPKPRTRRAPALSDTGRGDALPSIYRKLATKAYYVLFP